MMSPFTRATMRSMISAREEAERLSTPAARTRTLGRTRARERFMVHLGPGHEVPDELLDALVRLPAQQLGAAGLAAIRHPRLPGRDPLLHAQHVEPERALHDVAGLPRVEGEGGPLQLRRQLAAREDAHGPARARLGGAGARLRQHGEAL